MQGTRDLAEAVLRDAMGPEADGKNPKTYQNVPSIVPARLKPLPSPSAGFGSQRALAIDFRNRRCRGKQGGEQLEEMTCCSA